MPCKHFSMLMTFEIRLFLRYPFLYLNEYRTANLNFRFLYTYANKIGQSQEFFNLKNFQNISVFISNLLFISFVIVQVLQIHWIILWKNVSLICTYFLYLQLFTTHEIALYEGIFQTWWTFFYPSSIFLRGSCYENIFFKFLY